MSINRIQFQPDLTMSEFYRLYGTEAKCFYTWRWPHGFRCPACNGRARSRFRRADAVYCQCRACRHQTTLSAGTLLGGTKLPLRVWMQALYLLTSTKTNVSTLELMRDLGISYKSAWRLKHKIMQAMSEREDSRKLNGFVQIDDACLSGERNGGKAGRGSENKQPILVAVQAYAQHKRVLYAVLEPIRAFDNATLDDWIARRLEPECEVYTDGLGCFRRLEEAGHAHTTLVTRGGRVATEVTGALSQHRAFQRQARAGRGVPRRASDQVRASVSGRSRIPVQPPIPPARNACATGNGADALQALY